KRRIRRSRTASDRSVLGRKQRRPEGEQENRRNCETVWCEAGHARSISKMIGRTEGVRQNLTLELCFSAVSDDEVFGGLVQQGFWPIQTRMKVYTWVSRAGT